MTMAWSRAGATRCSCFDRDPLDAARRAQRLDLEPQMAVDFFLRRPLPLHPLDLVAVAQQLEVLPGREQQDDDQEHAPIPTDRHSCRCRASSTSRTIGLLRTSFLIAYSKSIAAHASLSIARSFALRARGLRATSASAGLSGRFVSDAQRRFAGRSSARNVCFTMRSSSE